MNSRSQVIWLKDRRPSMTMTQAHNLSSGEIDSTGKGLDNNPTVPQLKNLLADLAEIFDRAKIAGWDGDDAEPISDAAFFNATKLLSVLPLTLPIPEVVADNDGYIEFEWSKDRKTFSVYVTDTNIILYAGFYGKEDHLSGRFVFEGNFPDRMESLAREVFR